MGFDNTESARDVPLGNNAYDKLRSAVGAWWENRRAQAAVQRMEREAAAAKDQHAHSRFWLLKVPALATICAALVEWYWAVLFCLAATGTLAVNWATSIGSAERPAGLWHFSLDIQNVAVLIGLILATMPIVMLSMIWLPVQFAMRGAGRFRRGTLITVGLLANLLVIVSGTVVMNLNRQDHVRAALVTEQRGDAGRLAIVARRDAVHQRWATLTESSNTTLQAQAARAGVAGWDSYITTARQQAQAGTITPQRLALIERARGSAVAAEAYQQQEDALTGQIAAAAPAAATQAHVQDDVGQNMDAFAQNVQVYRPPFVALVCTLIGIFGAWWVLAMLERLNPRDVMRSGWASEAERIEDMREQPEVVAQPMKAAETQLRDADTKEIIVDKDGDLATKVKEHTRKLKREGKPVKMMIQPDIPPNESGAPAGLDHGDGGLRSAALHGEHEPVSVKDDVAPRGATEEHQQRPASEQSDLQEGGQFVEPLSHPEISEEEALAAQEELMAAALEEAEQNETAAENNDAQNDKVDDGSVHSSLLQTPPQQVADLGHDVSDVQDGEEDQPAHEEQSESHDDGLTEAFARANGRAPETDPRRLITADAE